MDIEIPASAEIARIDFTLPASDAKKLKDEFDCNIVNSKSISVKGDDYYISSIEFKAECEPVFSEYRKPKPRRVSVSIDLIKGEDE